MKHLELGEVPVKVDIWLRTGEKVSTIGYLKSSETMLPGEICDKFVDGLGLNFFSSTSTAFIFGGLVVRVEDVSAIKVSPFVN